jgi:hypothetical protein
VSAFARIRLSDLGIAQALRFKDFPVFAVVMAVTACGDIAA